MNLVRNGFLILICGLMVCGCSLRKDEEEFPDEFAQGLDYAEESKIEYLEMDESGAMKSSAESPEVADLDYDPGAVTGAPPASPEVSSVWDPGPTDAFEPADLFPEEPVADMNAGADVEAPIGGGLVPPRGAAGAAPTFSSNEVVAPDMGVGATARAVSQDPLQSGKSGLQFNEPPRLLANARTDFKDMSAPFQTDIQPSTQGDPPSLSFERQDSFEKVQKSAAAAGSATNYNASGMGGGDPALESSMAARAVGSTARDGAGTSISPSGPMGAMNPIPQSMNVSVEGDRATSPVPASTDLSSAVPDPTDNRPPDNPSKDRSALPDAKTLKQQGIDAYHGRDFDKAIVSFRDYLSAYTEEETAVRAWLGYALMQDRRFGEASKEFDILLNCDNPELRGDAHYYLGLIAEKGGDFESARVRWEQVLENYPDTKAADKARSSLERLSP